MALELKDNNARYFIVNKNDEYLTDFVIYNKNNLITLDRQLLKNKEVVEFIFYSLVEYEYEFITEFIPVEMKDIIKNLKEIYNVKEEIIKQGNFEYIKIKINLM